MNNCCQQLDDYLDGDLTADEQSIWQTLAHDCPHCQQVLRQQASIDQSLQAAWNQIEPPADVTVEASPAQGWKGQGRRAGLLVLVASVLIAAVMLSWWPLPTEEPGRRDPSGVSIDKSAKPSELVELQSTIREPELPPTTVASDKDLVVPIASEPQYTIVLVAPVYVRSDEP